MFVIKFHSTSLPANIQIHICVQRCPSSVLCYSLSSCLDTCNCVLLAIAKVALPISPWQLLIFCLRFKLHSNRSFPLYHQLCRTGIMIMILGIVAVTMKSEICNGSPSLQSALWQSESCSVKERERILHRLHCAKAGLSFVVSLALPQPPSALPVQCSTVHCAPVPPSVVPMDSGPPQALSTTSCADSGPAPMESVEAASPPEPVSFSAGHVVFSGGVPVAVTVGEPLAVEPFASTKILECTVALEMLMALLNRLYSDLLAARHHPVQTLVILLLSC